MKKLQITVTWQPIPSSLCIMQFDRSDINIYFVAFSEFEWLCCRGSKALSLARHTCPSLCTDHIIASLTSHSSCQVSSTQLAWECSYLSQAPSACCSFCAVARVQFSFCHFPTRNDQNGRHCSITAGNASYWSLTAAPRVHTLRSNCLFCPPVSAHMPRPKNSIRQSSRNLSVTTVNDTTKPRGKQKCIENALLLLFIVSMKFELESPAFAPHHMVHQFTGKFSFDKVQSNGRIKRADWAQTGGDLRVVSFLHMKRVTRGLLWYQFSINYPLESHCFRLHKDVDGLCMND